MIINMATTAAHPGPIDDSISYVASKSGVIGMTRQAAKELAPQQHSGQHGLSRCDCHARYAAANTWTGGIGADGHTARSRKRGVVPVFGRSEFYYRTGAQR